MEGGVAAGADVLPDAVVGDFGHEVPAAGAFVAAGGEGGNGKRNVRRAFDDLYARDVDDFLQAGGVALEKLELISRSGDLQLGFEALSDSFGLAGFFKDAESFVADGED